MRLRYLHLVLLLGAVLAASSSAAYAYVGPGAGLSAIGSVVSVAAAMLLAVAGFVWYPLKRLFKRVPRGGANSIAGNPSVAESDDT